MEDAGGHHGSGVRKLPLENSADGRTDCGKVAEGCGQEQRGVA